MDQFPSNVENASSSAAMASVICALPFYIALLRVFATMLAYAMMFW